MTETWLSQEAYDRLQAEHLHLTTVGREEASKAIEIARQHGDLRENAEYDSAKEEQGKMESRIKQLVELLREAKIGQPTETDVVAQGLVVTLDIDGDQEQFLVGNREDSHETFEILSAASPIGRAIEGRKVGDEAVAQLPNGGSLKVTVSRSRRRSTTRLRAPASAPRVSPAGARTRSSATRWPATSVW